MIAVLASASAWAEIQAVAGDRRCFLSRDEDEFLRLAGEADAVVLEAENLVSALRVVRHINRDHPLLPVILITEQDSADLRQLASVSVEAVLFQHQIAARLSVALSSSAGIALGLRSLGEECMRNESIPAPLRRSSVTLRIVKTFIVAIFLSGFVATGVAAQTPGPGDGSVGDAVECANDCHDHGQAVYDLTGSKKSAWAAENACVIAFCG